MGTNTWLPGDERLIQRTRQTQRCRRPLGLILAVVGTIAIVLVLYVAFTTYRETSGRIDQLSRLRQPTTRQFEQVFDTLRYTIGLRLGFALGTTLVFALHFAFVGLELLFGGRKNRLLLKCWDQLHSQG